ncbi:NAD(P)-binding protein [Aulographum hederae CBS 113979]|uniref:NAD(P)-binding protein n=1 Tax=Aulographum hederae CBS 113979 TaxID=1176131 RepID=A0A6G1GLC4_9PEZI|nr:NAD(P)-binding protein [Aulographum hederae CBS 113979]
MSSPFPSATKTWHSKPHPAISPSRPELSAKGKTIVVTGGGTGIGAATAHSFAEAGASRIALLGRREQPLLDTKASIQQKFPGVDVFTASTDVTKKDSVEAAFSAFVGADGKIDVLVSNAAIMGPKEPVQEVDGEKFVEGVKDNLTGSLFVAQTFLRLAAPNAVVVDVSSGAAHMQFGNLFGSYSVAKIAIVRLWDFIAYGVPDLRVYHIQPGVVNTDLNRAAGGVAALGYEDDAYLPGNFSVWLASPEAAFLKGKFLWANWDVDELKARAKELETGSMFNVGLVGWPFAQDFKPDDSKWEK